MSQNLSNLLDAIKAIKAARLQATGVDFAWNKLYNAEQYIQKQVDSHFAI